MAERITRTCVCVSEFSSRNVLYMCSRSNDTQKIKDSKICNVCGKKIIIKLIKIYVFFFFPSLLYILLLFIAI